MEELLANVPQDPWVFLGLALLTAISAIQPIYVFFKYSFRLTTYLLKNGFSKSADFLKQSLNDTVFYLESSPNISIDLARIFLYSLLIFGSTIVIFILIACMAVIRDNYLVLSALSERNFSSEVADISATARYMIIVATANLILWVGHAFYHLYALRLLRLKLAS